MDSLVEEALLGVALVFEDLVVEALVAEALVAAFPVVEALAVIALLNPLQEVPVVPTLVTRMGLPRPR